MIANRLGQRPIRARAVQATGNIYYWDSEGLDGADALLPGITGLGVADFRLEPGFLSWKKDTIHRLFSQRLPIHHLTTTNTMISVFH